MLVIRQIDVNMFMVGLNLTYSDRASMATSVEKGLFIDKEVVEYAMKVPGRIKYQKKESKYILRRSAEAYLPHEIIYRSKASFGVPIRSWISGDIWGLTADLLSEKVIKERGVFNPKFVKKMIEENQKGIEDHAYRIYQLITIEIWMGEFVDI